MRAIWSQGPPCYGLCPLWLDVKGNEWQQQPTWQEYINHQFWPFSIAKWWDWNWLKSPRFAGLKLKNTVFSWGNDARSTLFDEFSWKPMHYETKLEEKILAKLSIHYVEKNYQKTKWRLRNQILEVNMTLYKISWTWNHVINMQHSPHVINALYSVTLSQRVTLRFLASQTECFHTINTQWVYCTQGLFNLILKKINSVHIEKETIIVEKV